jgi:hypothetical protein
MPDSATVVGECPDCRNEVEVTQVWEPGGVNDYGGFILECAKCRQRFPFHVGRDIDMSSVAKGARVLDKYDDGIVGDREEALKRHGIKEVI